MKFHITLKTAIMITRYAITPIACWPVSRDASVSKILLHNLTWWLGIIHLVGSSSAWFYNIYLNSDDADIIVQTLTEVCAMTSTVAKMTICKLKETQLEELLAEVMDFLDEATTEEAEVLQFYVDKCVFSHTIVLICSIVGPIAYIAAPAVTSQMLPGGTAYPFSLDSYWIWLILYVSHSLIIMQVGCMAILDFMFAILLWYTGARFEMLCNELERATSTDDVMHCIRKHQILIEYVERLKIPTRVMAVEVTSVGIFAVTTGGFVLIRNPPWYIVAKYVFFEFVSALELFLFTWPADNLIEMSEKIRDAAYGCSWIGKSPKMMKNLIIMMQRAEIPSVISINGVLPALSLQLYGSAMSTSFSYLTTLRAITTN